MPYPTGISSDKYYLTYDKNKVMNVKEEIYGNKNWFYSKDSDFELTFTPKDAPK
jgi:hypothetical protein